VVSEANRKEFTQPSCFVRVAKMTHQTRHFNSNQNVWLQYMSGALAAKVVGKYRGRGRYVSAWIKWDIPSKPPPEWKPIAVAAIFAERHSLTHTTAPDPQSPAPAPSTD